VPRPERGFVICSDGWKVVNRVADKWFHFELPLVTAKAMVEERMERKPIAEKF